MRDGSNDCDSSCCFLHDGRLKIDSDAAQRSIQTFALNRRSTPFAGSNECGDS